MQVAAIQRHGELRLRARLTEAFDKLFSTEGGPFVEELLQADKTSWEEYRLEHTSMACVLTAFFGFIEITENSYSEEQESASSGLEMSSTSDSTKNSDEPEPKRVCTNIG